MAATPTPVFFGPEERPLFGWVHQPEDGLSRGTVILCPPLVREWISAHFTYRVLAEKLAEHGLTAIRFDYDGTGDSAGVDTDPRRIAAYEASIDHAITLADDLGTTEVALLGMRMGALFAARAAARCERVAALVLWDPCASGREFLREQSALFRLTYGKSTITDGSTEVAGFVFSEETATDLKALGAPEALPSVERALLLTRPERPAAGTFGVAEGRLESAVAEGQDALLNVEPFESEIPVSVEAITGWLDTHLPEEHHAQKAPESRVEATVAHVDGRPITERLVTLGPERLFGLVTTTPAVPAVGPWLVFLTSGCEAHIGPNRLWVQLARALAGQGFRSLRFDLGGLGDSPAGPGRVIREDRTPNSFDDIEVAVAEVAGPADATATVPAVLVGLCSGGYQALDSGLDLPARGVIAINPILRFPPLEAANGPVDPRRRFCRPVVLSVRSFYQSLPDWAVVRLARRAYLTLNRLRARQETPLSLLEEMAGQGTNVLCLCGAAEAEVLFEGSPEPTEKQITLGGRARIDIVDDLDHGIIPAPDRARTATLVTEYLSDLYL